MVQETYARALRDAHQLEKGSNVKVRLMWILRKGYSDGRSDLNLAGLVALQK